MPVTRPPRVLYLFDLPLPAPLAAPIQILHTARAMAELGTPVTTAWGEIAGDPGDALAHYGVAPHPDLRLIAYHGRLARLMPRRSLGRLLKRLGPFDVVMSRGEQGATVFDALRRLPGRPAFVYEAHRRAEPGFAKLEAQVVREADGLVCISEGVREALIEAYAPACPTLVLPSGVQIDDDDSPRIERDIDVLYAGKLEVRKGLDVMLAALPHLPAGVRFTLVGDARGLDISAPNVDLVGYVEPSRVRGYFRRARAAVCPLPGGVSDVSDRFTSPMKILEAMAAGAPVVATNLPSVREILSDERNALLVPPNDPPALAAAIRRLLDDSGLAARLAAQAKVDMRPYGWAERGRKLARFLQSVVARP